MPTDYRIRILKRGPPKISLEELRWWSRKGGKGLYLLTKGERRELERRGKRLARANREWRKRQKREARIALALLGGKGGAERAQVARETWERRLRPPIGSLATDRAIIAAMWPAAPWRSARQINERIDWTQFGPQACPKPSLSWLYGPLRRLMAHGMVEREVRGENYVKSVGCVKGVHGCVPAQFFRLTEAGIDLRDHIDFGIVPKRSSRVRFSPRPIIDNPRNQKTLCAMTPGAWQSVGEICLVLGLSRKDGPERATVSNALGRLLRAGAVRKAQNPQWERPGPEEPRNLYQLTERGERLREGLLLIGNVML